MKYYIALFLLVFVACGEEFNKEDDQSAESFSDEAGQMTDLEGFDVERATLRGSYNLSNDMYVSAKTVVARDGVQFKLNGYDLTIEAETIDFNNGATLYSFEEDDYADCRKNGKNSGDVTLNAAKISGSIDVDLAGQNAGQVSSYYKDDAIHGPVYEDDHESEYFQYLFISPACELTVHVSEDSISNYSSLSGGNAGRIYLNSSNLDDLSYRVSDRQSLGSFRAKAWRTTKSASMAHNFSKGKNGNNTEYCLITNESIECK